MFSQVNGINKKELFPIKVVCHNLPVMEYTHFFLMRRAISTSRPLNGSRRVMPFSCFPMTSWVSLFSLSLRNSKAEKKKGSCIGS